VIKTKNSKVVVISGGISKEREVSLRSGRACFSALNRKGYNVSLLDLESIEQIIDLHNSKSIDVAFLCTHGDYGEDGKLQGVLEWLKIPYTGSRVLGSALCMNKYVTKSILQASGITTPKACLLGEALKNDLNFPLIIKPIESGSSIGVEKLNNYSELEDKYYRYEKSHEKWLIEEFIEGTEVTVSLLQVKGELKILPILELKSKNEFYDYEAKYTKGKTDFILPAQIEPEVKKKLENFSLKAFRLLNCHGFARVDAIIHKDSKVPYVLELNTLPGMTETSDLPAQAKEAGINFDELAEFMLESAV
jgi:D-alanine-D-alanine ligase